MTELNKEKLIKEVNMGAREYGISTVLFRHAVGDLLGLNVTDMECLALIFFKGLSTPSELSRYTGLTSGATTAMLDRLEKARFIARRPNPNDRRGTLIVPTNERTAEVSALFTPAREAIDELTGSYTAEELAVINDYFTRIIVIWEEERKQLQKRIAGKQE